MIRLLIEEARQAEVFLLAWLFVLLFAQLIASVVFGRRERSHAVGMLVVSADTANVLITCGWLYLLLVTAFSPGDRILAWTLEPLLPGIAVYVSLLILTALLATTAVLLIRSRGEPIGRRVAEVIPVVIALLIAIITVRIPFIAQAVIDALP